jgi:uncharacterized membrane protein
LSLNIWEIKIAVVIQAVLLFSLLFDVAGYSVPLLRQIVGFVFVTIVPGMLLIKILKVDLSSKVSYVLVVVGLSIAFVLSLELVANALYPFVGIVTPLSTVSIEATLLFSTSLLCVLAFIRREKNDSVVFLAVREPFLKRDLILCLFLLFLPVLSILGSFSINTWNNDLVTLVLLTLLPAVPILVGFNQIKEKLYPYAIVSIALSLLFHNSLISTNLVEWGDVSWEYFFANKVLTVSVWNPATFGNFNAIPSVEILAPIFAKITNLDLTTVFKVFYPIIYALVPLGIYQVVRRQIDGKTAFLSGFLFSATYFYFTSSLGANRFIISSFFFILFVLMLTDEHVSSNKSLLAIVFSVFIVVSHYSTGIVLLGVLILSLLLLALMPKLRSRFLNLKSFLTLVLFLVVASFAWFTYISSSSVLIDLVTIGRGIFGQFSQSFLSQNSSQTIQIITGAPVVPLLQVTKVLYLMVQFFIVVGVVRVLLKGESLDEKAKINTRYFVLSFAMFFLVFATLVIPSFASTIDTVRFFGISLLLLGPFCVVGVITVISIIAKPFSKFSKSHPNRNHRLVALKVVSVLFAMFLVFNTGLVFELSGEPISFSLLNLNRTEAHRPNFSDAEISAVKWFCQYLSSEQLSMGIEVRSDFNSAHLLKMYSNFFYPLTEDSDGNISISRINGTYVLLGREVLLYGVIRIPDIPGRLRGGQAVEPFFTNSSFFQMLSEGDKIFDDGDSQLFYYIP